MHLHVVGLGLIEMDPVRPIEFGPGRQNVFLVQRMDHKQHV
jgi:hypothetical protein